MTDANIGESAQADQGDQADRDDLPPWLRAMVDVVVTETTPSALLYVPEITLRLAAEAVPLWDRIDRELKLNRGPPYWPFAWAAGAGIEGPDYTGDRASALHHRRRRRNYRARSG